MSHLESHYTYIEQHGKQLSDDLGVDDITELLVSHGDKCYNCKESWYELGIPFAKGVMIYLLTKQQPYDKEVRDTSSGWVSPFEWIEAQYIFKDSAIRIALDKLP